MKRISRENYSYQYNKNIKPVLEIEEDEEILIETYDSRTGTLPKNKGEFKLESIPYEEGNPVTGPIFVKNCLPGDVLGIKIINIDLKSPGWASITSDVNIIKGILNKNVARPVKIKNGKVIFNKKIQISVRPMIGCIGVATEGKPRISFLPGDNGGNLDINAVQENANVFLPVFVKGGLFFLGDVHAIMGDGELTGGGVDIQAEVIVKFNIIKNYSISGPIIENKEKIITTGNANNFENAGKKAIKRMVNLLEKRAGVSMETAVYLIGMCGNLSPGQTCGLKGLDKTVYLSLPKFKLNFFKSN